MRSLFKAITPSRRMIARPAAARGTATAPGGAELRNVPFLSPPFH
jgi:hypothetical protein